ncbi:MAG TPA: DUF3800 domain-containing protein [Candidatus Saccharimonadales bacterium]|nr:DUF3800 domain-containing protein [Candidatus Saccharimonadales bacterium]
MKLLYIDESGDTVPISQGGKNFFTLTGCIIDELDFGAIEEEFRKLKSSFYSDQEIEFKANFLRYANPDIPNVSSPLKLNDRGQYNQLENILSDFMKKIPVTVISIVIDKALYWKDWPAQNPYSTAYVFLLERFNMFLTENDSLGMAIIDPREGQVNKQFIGDHLRYVHRSMRYPSIFDNWHGKTDRVIERLLYSASEDTIGIQLADIYGYATFHIYEYKKKANEYWRFSEVTLPKMRRGPSNQLKGYGLKIYPKSKIDPFS